jgi:limonene-1,2-epoxide hydrolase
VNPSDVVRNFHEAMQARDWDRAARYLSPTVRIEYVATGEVFEGPTFLQMNRDYPDGWSLEVIDAIGDGNRVALRVRVTQNDDVFWCGGYYKVEDELIVSGVELWVTAGGETAPEWRAAYTS